MMSQQQNPPGVSQSVLQEKGSEETNKEANVKPFSIRQYALACRQRSILHSWPFPEKYLHMCLNHDIRDVLPPFESLKGCSNLKHLRDDSEDADFCRTEVPHLVEHPQNIENECGLLSDVERYKVTNHTWDCPSSYEEGDQHNCTAPSKAKKNKRRRDRRRCKKRSMKDILAVAEHCTLQQVYIYI